MNALKHFKLKHCISYILVGGFAAVFTVLSLTEGLPGSTLLLLEKMAISILLAVSLNLVVGFLGELSLGHAGFMCVGAYLGGKTSVLLEQVFGSGSVLALVLSLIVGGAVAAVFGFIIGLPALRLKGDYLAIVTLAFGEIVRSVFLNTSKASFGGTLGLTTPRFDKNYLFIYAFIAVLIALAVIQNLMRSKHGRAITAIRDNEIAARATGVNVTKYKLVAFMISACFAGVAGVLYSYSQNKVQSSTFDFNYSIDILVMVVLGGMGNITGSVISASLITYLNIVLSKVLTNDLAILQNFFYALILILIVIYNNAPAFKPLREKLNLKKFLEKFIKSKHDPAKRTDDGAQWDRIPTKIEMDELISVDAVPDRTYKPDEPRKEKR